MKYFSNFVLMSGLGLEPTHYLLNHGDFGRNNIFLFYIFVLISDMELEPLPYIYQHLLTSQHTTYQATATSDGLEPLIQA